MTQTKPMPITEQLIIYRLQRGITNEPLPTHIEAMRLTPHQRRRLRKKSNRLFRLEPPKFPHLARSTRTRASDRGRGGDSNG